MTTDFGSKGGNGKAMAIQPDGRIVVAGNSGGMACDGCGPSSADFALARYNADGSPDTTFGGDGKVTTDFGSFSDLGEAVAIQPDGRIVVAGSSYVGSYDFALARYNANGSLDTTFGSAGKVTTNFGSFSDLGYDVAIQPDGRIVVVGSSSAQAPAQGAPAPVDFALARYNTDGSLDTTFGSAGKVTTDLGQTDSGNAVALQPDGRIVVAGSSNTSTASVFALARYNANGSLDTTFGSAGKVTTVVGSGSDAGKAVALQPDGRIVVAGWSHNTAAQNSNFALARYNTDGSLDLTFGTGGKVTTNFGSSALANPWAVALQPDGRIVVAGYTNAAGSTDFALARYNADGSLDLTFDVDGKVTTDFGSLSDYLFAVAIQPDGRIVAAGFTDNPNADYFAIVRYQG